MKRIRTVLIAMAAFGLCMAEHSLVAAPAEPQGLITGKLFSDIGGTAVANLTNNAKFPGNPDDIFFFPYFEWNATGDIFTLPGEFADNYGGQIVGYFYPPTTSQYWFYIAADDNAVLYLSTDDNPANKKLIAQETAWSNSREYLISGGNSDLTAKDSSQFAGSEWPQKVGGLATISLEAGQPYYIEALFKEGTGGDFLSVSAVDVSFFTMDSTAPIPGQYLATDRTVGPATITRDPQSQTVDERGSVTFSVQSDGTPPYTYQWRRAGVDIQDATNVTYTVTSATMADNGVAYSVVVTGADGSDTSADAILTVTPDTVQPTAVGASGSPGLTLVYLAFSEPLDQATAEDPSNYEISSAGGPLAVTDATLSSSGMLVTLTTAQQTVGTKYTILVNNVEDTAATPNEVPTDTKAVFFPAGELIDQDGMIVFEVEKFDRNLDGLWVADTAFGDPSVAMVVPNGTTGAAEMTTRLEFDINFAQAGTYQVWYRAAGANGNDDSAWFHLDGARPAERLLENDASMNTPTGAFNWASNAQTGTDPFTVDVATAGPHVVGIAFREDGAFFDKMILTTDTAFTPTGMGPAETREGAPGLPTITLTGPADGANFASGADVTLSADAAGQSGLLISRVEFLVNGNVVGEDTEAPFSVTWEAPSINVVLPFSIRAVVYDEMGQSAQSESVSVTAGTAPSGEGANIAWVSFHSADDTPSTDAGNAGFENAPDVQYTRLLEANGHTVTRFVTSGTPDTATLNTFDVVMISRSVGSGDYQDPPETAAWNGITAPTILMGGYILRNSRLGFTTGGDIPDTTGDIRLQAADPTHPIFNGIQLDSEGVMVDPYAGIVMFNGITQRGVSVNTNPLDGNGVVLATVATEGDPAVGGMIIAEWEAGDAINNDTAAQTSDTLGGDRLVFLTGSRENDGLTSHGAGIYDLHPAGAVMLLNAVNYMAGIEVAPAPTIGISREGDTITITFTGTLEATDSVDGTWEEVSTTSPYEVTADQPVQFFRSVQ